MRPQLNLHRSRVYALEPPRFGPHLTGLLAGLALTFFFGAAAVLALTGELPRMMSRLPGAGRGTTDWLVFALGTMGCLASIFATSTFGIRLFAVVSHRTSWRQIMENEGPCRLVQDASGLWGLQMELCVGTDPGARWPLTTDRLPPTDCHLFFRLDEAAAGAVSHLTSPDEPLVVRWLNLPRAEGGPTLLEVRSPLREKGADAAPVEVRHVA
jgi:hypothetical protein